MCVPGAHREQERALNTLELEFQMVVSHCLGAGNWAWPSLRGASVLTVEPSLQLIFDVLKLCILLKTKHWQAYSKRHIEKRTYKIKRRINKMTQNIKVLAAKPDDPSSIHPGELIELKVTIYSWELSLTSIHVLWHMCTWVHMHTHRHMHTCI